MSDVKSNPRTEGSLERMVGRVRELEIDHDPEGWPAVQMRTLSELADEIERLRERERLCETHDKAEKLALIRALQEIRDAVGLIGDGVSPRDIVEATRRLASNVKWSEPGPK